MDNYDTVVAALNGLKAKGYDLDFNIALTTLNVKHKIFVSTQMNLK